MMFTFLYSRLIITTVIVREEMTGQHMHVITYITVISHNSKLEGWLLAHSEELLEVSYEHIMESWGLLFSIQLRAGGLVINI